MRLSRLKAAMAGLFAFLLVACGETPTEVKAPDPLGDFKLGHLIIFAKNAQIGPLSREATPEEFENAIRAEIQPKLAPLQGTKFFNVSVSVDAYILAVPGIPIVASPSSGIVVSLNVWDDAAGKRILEENKRFTVAEKFSAKSFFGSGLTQSKEEQIASLAEVVVRQIDIYLRENEAAFIDAAKSESDT